jgi:hypothetical protein
MKSFFLGALRLEFAFWLALLIGAALFATADSLLSFVGPWFSSMNASALRWITDLAVMVVLPGLVLGCMVWRRQGRGQAVE